MSRESMEFDVIIVGGGPAGLSAACRLMQQSKENNQPISICVLEKGSEIGVHILSGAILDPIAINELFPNWYDEKLATEVLNDGMCFLFNQQRAMHIPNCFTLPSMDNKGCYIVSLGKICRWLATEAEKNGVEIFPGFVAHSLIVEQNQVKGVITGDMGLDRESKHKANHMLGMELRAKYTIFAEGCRGHLGKQLIKHFSLAQRPQHYALGIKELWSIPEDKEQKGSVLHTIGWPLMETKTMGGGFMYQLSDSELAIGMVVDLNYHNPWLDPYQEFQRFKTHPVIRKKLHLGKRIAYGARAIAKGGWYSLPKMTFSGGILIGCDAGTLNGARIKGNHTAMKSGILAADAIFNALKSGNNGQEVTEFNDLFKSSWLYKELYEQRNFSPILHKYGLVLGGALNWLNMKCGNKLFAHVKDDLQDHQCLKTIKQCKPLKYPKPDGVITFDRMSSVFLSNTNHEENQPCHLHIIDKTIPLQKNLPLYGEPAQRYCPAGVYEIVQQDGYPQFKINAQNCIHCKTCDIKDVFQNINWMPPEAGGGPNYSNM